jgi:hypothetical protein
MDAALMEINRSASLVIQGDLASRGNIGTTVASMVASRLPAGALVSTQQTARRSITEGGNPGVVTLPSGQFDQLVEDP